MRRLLADFSQLGELDAAAVFGNAGHESKGLTDDQEDKPVVVGSRGGGSWMQWTGVRRRQLEAFADEHGLDADGDEAAYLFMVEGLRGVREAVPEVRPRRIAKLGALIAGAVASLWSALLGVLGGVEQAKGLLTPGEGLPRRCAALVAMFVGVRLIERPRPEPEPVEHGDGEP